MVIGEGGGVLALEDLEHAQRRGARIYAEVIGFGSSFDREKNGQGLARAIRSAIAQAGITPDDLDHVNAHGYSSVESDIIEARGIVEALGDRVPVFAPKSYFGNLGAGGAPTELTASVLAVTHGQVPATLNYEEADPACPVSVIAGSPRPSSRPCFLKVSFTDMGQCAAVVCRRWDAPAGHAGE
jgi:3-oxoacyl-[acyl-carrier-protein] synthase II